MVCGSGPLVESFLGFWLTSTKLFGNPTTILSIFATARGLRHSALLCLPVGSTDCTCISTVFSLQVLFTST